MSETTVGKILEEIWISVNDKGLEERRLTIKKARKTRTLFELLVATILSQNTNSRNSSRAFRNLLKRKLIHPKSIIEASMDEIRDSIKVAGLYNRKSIKLKELAQIFMEKDIEGELKQLLKEDVNRARGYLLNLPAIGRKTADIVLLFHYGKPVMPIETVMIYINLYICLAILVLLVIMEKKEKMLRSGEVAEILGVDRHTVVKWIKEGKVKAIRLPSGRYRIPESEVKKILEGSG